MSLFGDLLAGGGALAGAFMASNDQKKANQVMVDQANQDRAQREKFLSAGNTNVLGDTFNKFNPSTGNFENKLSPETENIYKGFQGAGSNIGKAVPGLFDDLVKTGGAPGMSLDNARNAVNADNSRLFSGLVNPALEDASIIAQRTGGGSSNQNAIVNRAMERLLPQIQFGTEKDVQDLFSSSRGQYTDWLNSLLNTAKGSAAALNPTTDTSDLAQIVSSLGNTAVAPYVSSPNVGNALATLGNAVNTYEAEGEARADKERLYKLLEGVIGKGAA